jgi:hypothetical protein
MTSPEIAKILAYLAMWIAILPIIVGIVKWKHLNKEMKIFLIYLVSLFICTIIAFIQVYLKVSNNVWLFSIMFGIDAFFTGWFYSVVLKPPKIRPIVFIIGILLNIYILIDSIWLNSSFLKSISGKSSILILSFDALWAIIFIYQTISNPLIENLKRNSTFWISVGSLFGAFIALFLVIYANDLWNYSKNLYNFVSNLANILNTLQYLVFTYAFYIKNRNLVESF